MKKSENETGLAGDIPNERLESVRLVDAQTDPRLNWREFFDANYRFVSAIARRLGGSRVDADDLVQEVFIVAHRRLHTFEERSSVTTWLYGICFNIVRRQRRAASRRAALASAFQWLQPKRSPRAPEAEVNDELRRVERTLMKMKEHERDVFVLREIEGLPAEDIAEILGVPAATVRTRHFSARRNFLALWEKGGSSK